MKCKRSHIFAIRTHTCARELPLKQKLRHLLQCALLLSDSCCCFWLIFWMLLLAKRCYLCNLFFFCFCCHSKTNVRCGVWRLKRILRSASKTRTPLTTVAHVNLQHMLHTSIAACICKYFKNIFTMA